MDKTNNFITFKNIEIKDLYSVAMELVPLVAEYKIILLEGEMGAGKTTFIKEIAKAFKVIDDVSSPTYSLVNEYRDGEDKAYFHFDFYRINDEEEALDIGVEDYLYSGNVCFLEWSSLIPSLIPEKFLKIGIEIQDENSRNLKVKKHG